jgi:hypothetical protein
MFPGNDIIIQKPAVGAHYWAYGVTEGFVREFNRDLKQAYNRGLSDVTSSSWVEYFPLNSRGKKPSEKYEELKEEIIKFAEKYAECATSMNELRIVYNDVLTLGVKFVGYRRQGRNILWEPDPVDKDKPLIGLTGPGIWGAIPRNSVGDEDKQHLGLTPLFVLKTNFGGIRKLPEISRSWHQLPAVLQFSSINNQTQKANDTTK